MLASPRILIALPPLRQGYPAIGESSLLDGRHPQARPERRRGLSGLFCFCVV
ncbi:MAG: hypothetical protein ORO03_04810 [Alphaproteobacteria bacterium]|nr:hypothetical protein [Alphaproteobacteria bacterium]